MGLFGRNHQATPPPQARPWRPLHGVTEDASGGLRAYGVILERPDVPGALIGVLFFPAPPVAPGCQWSVHRLVKWTVWDSADTRTWSDRVIGEFQPSLRGQAAAEEAARKLAEETAASPYGYSRWDGLPGEHCRLGVTRLDGRR